MSKTWDIVFVKKPSQIPCVVNIHIERSVTGIGYTSNPISNGQIKLVVGPCYMGSPVISRRLAFSEIKKPELDFPYTEAGDIKLNKKKVYMFLEDN